jgi:hypothetical protein
MLSVHWQSEANARSTLGIVFGPNVAAVRLDD